MQRIGLALVLLAGGCWAPVESPSAPAAAGAGATFTCPMHPEVKDDEASSCPSCGMKLVEVQGSADDGSPADHVVKVSTERQQLIGVKLTEVAEVDLHKALVAAGTLASDETRIVEVPSPVAGVVEEVLGNPIGQQVRKGEPLLVLASEDGSRTTIKATATGHIGWRVNTVGTKVSVDYKVASIYDHAGIWVWVEVFESDLPWVKVGQTATMTVPAYPGSTFEGRVTQVSPLLDPRTHTTRVRVDFWNSGFKLKPGMSAVLEIQAEVGRKVAVPESAVIRTGAENIVFVDAGAGRFEVRDVELGVLVGDLYEVVAGLKPGERIVSRGNFLVDSESKLQGIRASWSGGE